MAHHSLARVRRASSHGDRVQRRSAAPVALANPLLRLQRSLGNLAVQRFISASDVHAPQHIVAPSIVDDELRSSGKPLDAAARRFMEPRFNRDFGGVRIHTDGRAAESARAIDAAAYTAGNHVVFGAGRHAPDSSAGRRLLAHELTHAVQQTPHLHRQPERDPEADKEKEEANKQRVDACLKQPTELLPKVGVVEHINRDVALEGILGKERKSFENLIRQDYDARTFVCEAGVGAIMALFYNKDYKNRLHVKRARASFDAHPKLYSIGAFDTAQTTKALLVKTYRISIENGDKAWSTADIGLLAEALGTLTDQEKPSIGGYRFLRWSSKCAQLTANDKKYTCEIKDWTTCGLHLPDVIRGDYTISMYDCYRTDPDEFAKTGFAGQPGAETIVHEIGHAMEYGRRRLALEQQKAAKREYARLTKLAAEATGSAKTSLAVQVTAAKTALDAADKAVNAALSPGVLEQFVKLTKGKPRLTPYSAKNDTEAFAEAFMLFKVAPKKLEKANKPLFEWFKKGGFL